MSLRGCHIKRGSYSEVYQVRCSLMVTSIQLRLLYPVTAFVLADVCVYRWETRLHLPVKAAPTDCCVRHRLLRMSSSPNARAALTATEREIAIFGRILQSRFRCDEAPRGSRII